MWICIKDMNTLLLKCGPYLWIPQPKELWRPAHILSVTPDGTRMNLRWLDTDSEEIINFELLRNEVGNIFEFSYKNIPLIDLSCMDIINEPEGKFII